MNYSKRGILIHPTGNPFARNVAITLSEIGYLEAVFTTIGYVPDRGIDRLIQKIPIRFRKKLEGELRRRLWILPDEVRLESYPYTEMIRVILTRLEILKHLKINSQILADYVALGLDRFVANKKLSHIDFIYGYEDSACHTFQEGKKRGITCFYDLPIAHYRKVYTTLKEESEQYPDLSEAIFSIQEPAWKIDKKDTEIQLSDHIFVASSFTKESLLEVGINSEKITVVPYGAPVEYFQIHEKIDSCFRVLFVGQIMPRKGIHYLLKAWKNLNLPNSELLLVGANLYPTGWLDQYAGYFKHIPSVPHFQLNEYYTSANVFVFPSLMEGFGLVLLEAMACGIPVITTSHTAAPDLMTDGVEGFIIPIRDSEALQEKIEWCYHHPTEVRMMGKNARKLAETLTWPSYRQGIATKVKQLLNS